VWIKDTIYRTEKLRRISCYGLQLHKCRILNCWNRRGKLSIVIPRMFFCFYRIRTYTVVYSVAEELHKITKRTKLLPTHIIIWLCICLMFIFMLRRRCCCFCFYLNFPFFRPTRNAQPVIESGLFREIFEIITINFMRATQSNSHRNTAPPPPSSVSAISDIIKIKYIIIYNKLNTEWVITSYAY